MVTNLNIAVNADTQDQPYGTSGVNWVDLDLANDYIIFTAGSNIVKDGEPVPSSDELNQSGVVLTGAEIIISKYFLADISADELKEIHNMGNQDKRYVLSFDFDGTTASEPVLEIWDGISLNSIDSVSLGGDGTLNSGNPSSSWFRGIVTTYNTPGNDWVGSRLAGASSGNFLWLNSLNGALSVADTLYCNLKVVIPSTATQSGAETPVIAVKYTSN